MPNDPNELGATCEACGSVYRRKPNHPKTRFCSRSCGNVGRARPTLEERFIARVDRRGADECWPWTGPKNRGGYGRMLWRDGHDHAAPRIAYELANGWNGRAGAVVCHLCDNPACCNPAHLWVGSVADNNKDRAVKGRSCGGERHHSHRLTDAQVRDIRAAAGETLAQIAARYGVSISTIHGIRAGKKRTGVAA